MPRMVRSGIDLGTVNVKLVRGSGAPRLTEISHFGCEPWDPAEAGETIDRAAAALSRLLGRLHLSRGRLGHLAVAVSGDQASYREIILPKLSDAELRRALPFEAKKHLNLESSQSPILASQILGTEPPAEEEDTERMRVMLAAISTPARDFVLEVLDRCGLEPETIDLEPLAGLNGMLASGALDSAGDDEAVGLMDLGGDVTQLHIVDRGGRGPMSRPVGPSVPDKVSPEARSGHVLSLVDRTRETLTFYRGRYRLEVGRILLSGGGVLLPGLPEAFARALDRPVTVLDPFAGLGMKDANRQELDGRAALYTTACGLCRWWDETNV